MVNAATLRMGWMTMRWIRAPRMKPISGTTRKAAQKFHLAGIGHRPIDGDRIGKQNVLD